MLKKLKYLKILILGMLTLLIASSIYFYVFSGMTMSKHERQFEKALIDIAKSKTESVYLRDLTNFEWEKACPVYPYSSREDIDGMLGFRYEDYNKIKWWINDDSYWGLLFIDKKQNIIPARIKVIKTGRYGGDEKCIVKSKAKLVARYSAGHWGTFVEFKLVAE